MAPFRYLTLMHTSDYTAVARLHVDGSALITAVNVSVSGPKGATDPTTGPEDLHQRVQRPLRDPGHGDGSYQPPARRAAEGAVPGRIHGGPAWRDVRARPCQHAIGQCRVRSYSLWLSLPFSSPTAIEEPETRLTFPANATGNTANPAGESPPAWEKTPAAAVKEPMALEPVADRLTCPALLEEPQSPSSTLSLEDSLFSRDLESQAGTHRSMEAVPTGSPVNEVQFPVRPVENGLSCDLKLPVAEHTDAVEEVTTSADAPQW